MIILLEILLLAIVLLFILARYKLLAIIFIPIILNYFSLFKYGNIYWWGFYLNASIMISIVVLSIMVSGVRVHHYKREFILLFIFMSLGILSIMINYVNILDGLFIILLRIIPILFIIFTVYLFSSKIKYINRYIDKFYSLLKILIYPLTIIALIQLIFFGKVVDDLGSIPGNAHRFSDFAVIFSLILLLTQKNKLHYFILFTTNIILVIYADYKLGLVAIIMAIILSIVLKKSFTVRLPRKISYGVLALCIAFLILLSFPMYVDYLPPHYMLFISIVGDLGSALETSYVYPANMELFRGYVQLFSQALDNIYDYMIGVGPGNYASNVAIYKSKENAYKYFIHYRNILDRDGVMHGSLLNRANANINIIAEFGLIAAFIYFIIYLSLMYRIIKLYTKYYYIFRLDKYLDNLFFILLFLFCFLLFLSPIVSVVEEGKYIVIFSIIYSMTICRYHYIKMYIK